MDLHTLTIHEAHEKLKNRDFSARELTQALLKRIEEVEPKVKAYIIVTPEKALKEAEQADKLIAAGRHDAAYRYPSGDQRCLVHRGNYHDLRLKHPQQFCSGL